MIKTLIPGEALTRALERQQTWVDTHVDADELRAVRAARIRETERLTAENVELHRRLRMAKASLRARLR